MPEVTQKDVEHIAQLARLEVTPQEVEDLTKYFAGILFHFRKLEEADLKNLDPFGIEEAEARPLREDVLHAENWRESILREIPLREGDYIRVPRIMKEE
ncbi:MAG TPA: Asp-tRNA(Asn)/Glu-tRNA(Gln) amidotransferase subunit GatC [Synergistaceae bacterium]|nr:Asp-tRNA(Asn)/Glu-tRNA(Gln) amidotransferase subunit GatC [Synergistaceae bacterium]